MNIAVVAQPDSSLIPTHVAIIMDGNGRWAKARGLPRTAGHKKGADILRNLLPECQKLGVKYLTIYAFSSENWNRPAPEVSDLMQLLRFYLEREIKALHKNNIRLRVIGNIAKLDERTRKLVTEAEALTAANTSLTLTVALSYGAREELTLAVKAIATAIQHGKLTPDAITETTVSEYLYSKDLPDPDLLIRTGGEQRLSNFLLWQQAYTELFFTPVLWPDFSTEHLQQAIADFARRERRYGNAPAN